MTYLGTQSSGSVVFENSRQGVLDVAFALEDNDRVDGGMIAPGFRDHLTVQYIFHDTLQTEERSLRFGIVPSTSLDVGTQLGDAIIRAREEILHIGRGHVRPAVNQGPQFFAKVVLSIHCSLDPAGGFSDISCECRLGGR